MNNFKYAKLKFTGNIYNLNTKNEFNNISDTKVASEILYSNSNDLILKLLGENYTVKILNKETKELECPKCHNKNAIHYSTAINLTQTKVIVHTECLNCNNLFYYEFDT